MTYAYVCKWRDMVRYPFAITTSASEREALEDLRAIIARRGAEIVSGPFVVVSGEDEDGPFDCYEPLVAA